MPNRKQILLRIVFHKIGSKLHCESVVDGHVGSNNAWECASRCDERFVAEFSSKAELAIVPVKGALRPDPSRPGLGPEFKRSDAERMAKSN